MTAHNSTPANPAQADCVSVDLGDRSYSIHIGSCILDDLEVYLAPVVGKARLFFVTETTVEGLYADKVKAALKRGGMESRWFTVAPGEGSKSFATFEKLLNDILNTGIERTDFIVALGGGVVGDLAGFTAASLLRGIGFIQIPTTLLSQVDSSVGGKTGINAAAGKNLIGAFHQPKAVFIDPNVLSTLPLRELQAGYAEIVKYGLIDDHHLFSWLEKTGASILGIADSNLQLEHQIQAINFSCSAKARVVAEDELESGKRALLNLGHTFGHALEAECGYDGTLLHGEGVGIGMVMALDLSERMDIAKTGQAKRLADHLKSLGMMWSAKEIAINLKAETLLKHMQKDKKAKAGDIGFILGGIGKAAIHFGVDLDLVAAVLHDSIEGLPLSAGEPQ